MWLALCASTDRAALWASQGLRDRGLVALEVVSADMLAQSQRWEHRVGCEGASIDITLADGRTLRHDTIQGTLNRLVAVPYEPLLQASPADAAYAGQELTTFFLSWLYALPPPMLNPATPQGLASQWRHVSEWVWRTARAGLPTPPYTQASSNTRGVLDWPVRGVPPDTPTQMVFVIADQVAGALAPAEIHTGCQRLAKAAGTALLGIEFAPGTGGPWTFAGATPMPDLRRGGETLLDALAYALQQPEL
jgi:hypothetical protein